MRGSADSGSAGVAYAVAAYGLWGVTPAYWKALDAVPAAELLAWRVIWSLVVAAALVALARAGGELRAVLRSARHGFPILVSSLLIGANWFTFLWAVENDQILATSLGYYINPLVSVVFGIAFLKERLRPWQAVAFGVAALGVARMAAGLGALPWVALVLSFSFALYGLVRKTAPVGPVVGFALEIGILTPLAAIYLATLWRGDAAAFPLARPGSNALLAAAGVVTAAPLLLFNSAAKRLRLATLGFFQYLAPSLALLLAVFAYGEPFTRVHAFTFGCVWLALALYSLDSLRALRGT